MAKPAKKRASHQGLKLVIVPQYSDPTSKNLLMALPGELRNEIYSIALLHGPWPWGITGAVIGIHTRRGFLRKPEPGLLRVSKAIRLEAGSLYYGKYTFWMTVGDRGLQGGCAWLGEKFQNCGVGMHLQAKIHITSASWKNVWEWLYLGKLVFLSNLGDGDEKAHVQYWQKMVTTPRHRNRGLHRPSENRQMYATIRQALRELIKISVEARKRNIGYDLFEVLLEGWAATIIEKPKMISGPQKRDAAAASLRDMCMGARKKRAFSFDKE